MAKTKAMRDYTAAEANKRRDEALRAALSMPAAPHASTKSKNKKKGRSNLKAKRKK